MMETVKQGVYSFFVIVFKIIAWMVGLGIILIGGFLLTLSFYDINAHKSLFEEQFNQFTGQQVILHGPVRVQAVPNPLLNFKDIEFNLKVANDIWNIKMATLALSFGWDFMWTQRAHLDDVNVKNMVITTKAGNLQIEQLRTDILTTCCSAEGKILNLETNQHKYTGIYNVTSLTNRTKIQGKIIVLQGVTPLHDVQQLLRPFKSEMTGTVALNPQKQVILDLTVHMVPPSTVKMQNTQPVPAINPSN